MMAQVNAGRVRFVGRGEYNNSTQYYVFDLVSYNGNSYYAKADTIGNLPTNTTYWQLVAEKGNIGPTGLTGNGISSITKTSTTGLVDTYTITYTNGNTTTFDVSNGNGIDRIEKTATVGNKDTYTIYFTNGSTTTYEVSNGEVTREELEEEVERLSMIYNAFPTTTGEGEEPSINGTAEVPFKEIGLKGNTSQDGEPTPDTPIPVNVVTGDNEVKVEGKNLFDANNYNLITAYFDGNILRGESANKSIYISCEKNTTYTISKMPSKRFGVAYTTEIPANNVSIYGRIFNHDGNSITITTGNDAVYLIVWLLNGNMTGEITLEQAINTLQIEKSSTATPYEEHKEQTYPINLGSMELCKIGDYQDYLYKENGIWYKYGAIGKVVLDGTQTPYYTVAQNDYYLFQFSHTLFRFGNKNIYSNRFINASNWGINIESLYVQTSGANEILQGKILTSRLSEASGNGVKNWFSANNTDIYYPLATPTITEITDTTLIEQLDNLEKAYSYDTQTNISQTNQDKPFIISYEAILSLRNVLNS